MGSTAQRTWLSGVADRGLFLLEVCPAAVLVPLPAPTASFAARDSAVQRLSTSAVR